MEQKSPNQSGKSGMQHRQMDFVANKPVKKTDSPSKSQDVEPPVPVTSAKAAINAMYAEQKRKTEPILAPSAREAVNAAASQGAGRNAKSAANLHHGGSIQKAIEKNIDTSRTSAAALLTRAKSPEPSAEDIQPTDSFDPLASRLSSMKKPAKPAESKQEIPVIRTSLKLGSSAKPKPAPVVLPPNARMARVARPVGGIARAKNGLIQRRSGDVQIIQPNSINPGQATKRLAGNSKQLSSANEGALEVQIIPSSKSLPAKAPAQIVKSAPTAPARVPRPAGPMRDPQMLGGISRPANLVPTAKAPKSGAAPLWPAAAATALGPKPKFRPAPKGYASNNPSGVPTDSSYVMATPPKLRVSHNNHSSADLGVVEDYQPSGVPEPMNSTALNLPTKTPKEAPSIKADNTSNYSFSTKKKPVDNNRYALGGQSPFLKSVSVEKRPLSDNSAPGRTKIARPVIEDKPSKGSRKNVYAKKKSKSEIRQELPQRPTVIVPASRRSKVPLFFLILFTIILGAVVGAAAYLCFFQ